MTKRSYGTPDPATRRLGEEIARLRTARRLSRAELIASLYRTCEFDVVNVDVKSEAELAHLENGRKVKVSRKTIETLARALNCTRLEEARLLLCADRSVFGGDDGTPDVVAETLNYITGLIYDAAYDILSDLIGQRRAEDLDESEMLEIVATALELAIKRRQKQ